MLSLGMIVRDEARTIEVTLASVLPFVDEVVIGFAGESTDNTKMLVQKYVDMLPEKKWQTFDIEWTNDFSAARNIVLDACTGDYFLWLDGDDELVNGQKMAEYITRFPESPAFYMGYDYARDEQGNNTCFLIRERIVKRSAGWHWIGAIHEVLVTEEAIEASAKVPDVWVRHHKPSDKHDPMRNLSILYSQLEASEPTPDPRILAYLGSENAGRNNLTEAILHWNRFIKLSGWDEEKYQTQVKISNAHRALGNSAKALDAAYRAIEMKPEWPDAYISLARTYCLTTQYNVALEWLKIAATKPAPETMLITNPMEYTYDISVLIAVCYTQLHDWDMALQNYEQSYRLRQDPDIFNQMIMLKEEINNHKVKDAFLLVREHLARNDEWMKVNKLFDSLPKMLEKVPEIQSARQRTLRQTQHIGDQELMIEHYRTNPHWVPMDEEQFKRPDWLDYPRMRFALDTALKVDAKEIIDWGCSDGFISLPLARETGSIVYGYDADSRCIQLAQQRARSWDVNAFFSEGAVGKAWPGSDPVDLALFFEVIEHVDDPAETLTQIEASANHIAITTPYLAWESGQIAAWDSDEMKGHLRIFDLDDMEMLLTPRGRIHNLYKQSWGRTGWIFADYAVGAVNNGPSIVIGAMGGAEPWGPQKLKATGLGGSETAVIRLGEELIKQGARVTTYCPIDEPGIYNEVTFRDGERFKPEVRSDLYIAWRMPEAADWNINTRRLILWMHDTDAGDRLTPERAERFDNIVVLTEWHRDFFLSKYPFVDADKLSVIGNGVDLERFSDFLKKDPMKVVYTSSPDRGLDVILEHIWPNVVAQVPEAELHIYYGWNSFEKFMPSYPHLQEFKAKVDQLFLASKNVVQHGRIPQGRLATELQEATIWLYPTYFSETYCISAIEAQLAGVVPITNHLAALKETVRSGVIIEGDVYDANTQAKFTQSVVDVLTATPAEKELMAKTSRENAPYMTWATVAKDWMKLMEIPNV